MAIPNRMKPIMNRIAANPLMITTGGYWLIESSTGGDCLAKTGGEETEVPGHRDQVSTVKAARKPRQSEPTHWAA